MNTLLWVILGQCVFVVAVVFVLKGLLDKELLRAALEKFESCKVPEEIKEITVLSAKNISDEYKSHLESVRKRKMPQASLKYMENADLKGGVVIAAGDLFLDFSLSSRLQNFWS